MTERADTLRTMTRLIDTFGADIALQRREYPELTTVQRIRSQTEVELEATDWHAEHHACTCRADAHEPLMPDWSPVKPDWSPVKLDRAGRVAIIGPAPTWDDVKHRELGWSRAEKLLTEHLRHAGIPRGGVTTLCACWCWPQAGVKGQRPPTTAELDAWHPWLMRALEAADVDYVILHGSHALRAWRPDLKITNVNGGMYLWQDRWLVLPILHATNVLRPDGTPLVEWKRVISGAAQSVLDGDGLESFATDGCLHCRGKFYAWDGDGVPLCQQCWRKHQAAAERARERARQIKVTSTLEQGALL